LDYKLSNNLFKNILYCNKKIFIFDLNKINYNSKDDTSYYFSSLEINAYYSPYYNSVYIPYSIMHNPFYNYKKKLNFNYSTIGSIIGHEISHSLDIDNNKNLFKYYILKLNK
jgi:predicted metalloendopeptidase